MLGVRTSKSVLLQTSSTENKTILILILSLLHRNTELLIKKRPHRNLLWSLGNVFLAFLMESHTWGGTERRRDSKRGTTSRGTFSACSRSGLGRGQILAARWEDRFPSNLREGPGFQKRTFKSPQQGTATSLWLCGQIPLRIIHQSEWIIQLNW